MAPHFNRDFCKYREAADRIWSLADEYRANNYIELSLIMKDLAAQLHFEARKRELGEDLTTGDE